MKILRLTAAGFRNFGSLQIEPAPGINIIYGDNAQGKTNLIEAVWLFTGAKSFRGGRDQALCRFGEEQARLSLTYFAEGREQTAAIRLGNKRGAEHNGIPLESISRLAGSFYAVVFSPDHLSLVKEGPAERRRFLDTAIGQIYPKYIRLLTDYQRILTQRAALLRDISYNASLLDMLEIWDEHLCRAASQLLGVRRRYIERLSEHAAATYDGIAGGREQLSLSYLCTTGGDTPEEIAAALKAARSEDLRLQMTTVGPHRDDLELQIGGISARSFASQGQQRSAALALKLAEADVLCDITGSRPVILLDDVMSELDSSRRSYILNHIRGSQVLITCCDRNQFDTIEAGRAFCIRSGEVVSVEEIG